MEHQNIQHWKIQHLNREIKSEHIKAKDTTQNVEISDILAENIRQQILRT